MGKRLLGIGARTFREARVECASLRLYLMVRQPLSVEDTDVAPIDLDQPLRFKFVQHTRELLEVSESRDEIVALLAGSDTVRNSAAPRLSRT